jgi:hypothetical protein
VLDVHHRLHWPPSCRAPPPALAAEERPPLQDYWLFCPLAGRTGTRTRRGR